MSKKATRLGAEIIPMRPTEPPDGLTTLFNEYFTGKGVTPEQAKSNGIIPAYDDDPRAQAISTVYHHSKRRTAEGQPRLPGFLIEYGSTFHTFRYLCPEEGYPVDVNSKRKIKLASPSGVTPPIFQPACLPDDMPPGTPVRLCESAVKAIASTLAGQPALGQNGAGGGTKNKKLHPDYERMFRKFGWVPIITLDADANSSGDCYNSAVGADQRALVVALYDIGIPEVFVSVIPPYRKQKRGLDDYLGAGGRIGDLDQYLADEDGTASAEAMTMEALNEAALPPRLPLIEGFIRRGEAATLTGPPKCGKSRVALAMAISVATGGRLFDSPLFQCHKAEVLLFMLEDDKGDIRSNLSAFSESMGTPWPVPGIHLVTHMEPGSWVLTKAAAVIKRNPGIKLVIIDNEVKVDVISKRPEPTGTLVQREYEKRSVYLQFARDNNVTVYLLAHTKKGTGNTTSIADKGNSTNTAAGAVDHIHDISYMKADSIAPPTARAFGTDARAFIQQRLVIDMDDTGGAPVVVGEEWEFGLTVKQGELLNALADILVERGQPEGTAKAKEIAAALGPDTSASTTTKNLGVLAKKGWVNSLAGSGANSGFSLTHKALATPWGQKKFAPRKY